MKMIIDIDEKILKDMENGYIRMSELVQAVKNGKPLEKKKKPCCGNCKHYEPWPHLCVKKDKTVFYNSGENCPCFQPMETPS